VPKLDYLKECNTLGTSLEDFSMAFCNRCHQKECLRSQAGKSRFEQRVSTWEDRFFKNPPRMDPSDPRFEEFQARRFLEFNPDNFGPIPEIGHRSAWVDPKDVVQEPVVTEPEPKAVDQAPPPLPAPTVEPAPPAPAPAQAALVNTPFKQGTMLGGRQAPKTTPAPVYDPWAGPAPSQSSGDKIVKPGAKVRLGG
jgi:hypothetical protein